MLAVGKHRKTSHIRYLHWSPYQLKNPTLNPADQAFNNRAKINQKIEDSKTYKIKAISEI
jgi:hypothetical protein